MKAKVTITDIEIVTIVTRHYINGKFQSAVMQRRGNVELSRLLKIVRNDEDADGMFATEAESRAAAQQFIETIHPTQRYFSY